MDKNLLCIHCGKDISNDYNVTINSYTTMGPILHEEFLKKHWLWTGMNQSKVVCQNCFKRINNFIENKPNMTKVKKHIKEYNCPDCELQINSCMGCPRYRNRRRNNI